jgi:SP family facilitated glucose transporter-like MFS transporter 1
MPVGDNISAYDAMVKSVCVLDSKRLFMEQEPPSSLSQLMNAAAVIPHGKTAASLPPTGSLKFAAFLIGLSSFICGYGSTVLNVCIVENATGSMLVEFNLSDGEIELASSLVLIGAWFSALLTASLPDTYGRRRIILLNNVVFVSGACVCAVATSKNVLYVGRTLLGFACGIATNVAPVLMSEISPAHCRGQITALHQLMLTIGILGSSLLGYALVTSMPSGWRVR